MTRITRIARRPLLEAWSKAQERNPLNVNADKTRTHTYLKHHILVGRFRVSLFSLHGDRRPPLLQRRDAAVLVGAGPCRGDTKSVQDSAAAPGGMTGSTKTGRGWRGKLGRRLWKHDRNHSGGTCRTRNTQWPYLVRLALVRLASVRLALLPSLPVVARTSPSSPALPLAPAPRTLPCPATPTQTPAPS